jgi:GntR family transcriptional regulator
MIRLDPTSALPIWKQIEDGMRTLILTGRLAPGAVALSVRELAKDLRVNPATVSRAYQRLTEEGYLTVRRGEGTFISESPPTVSRSEQRRVLRRAANAFVTVLIATGVEEPDAIEEVRKTFRRLHERKRA